jgi:spore coat protein U-like protein
VGDTLNASSIAPSPASGTGNGNPQNFTVSGSIAPGQYSSPGAYTGTVVVTANFV